MRRTLVGLIFAAAFLPGCYDDTTAPPPIPAAPRGLYSVTGDTQVTLHWLANTEPYVAGYNVFEGPCASGADCPYELIGSTTGTSFTVTGLANGVTRYYAVSAFAHSGAESDLSYEDVYDTPRPAGTGAVLSAYQRHPASSGWEFSAFAVRPWDDARTDMFFGSDSLIDLMYVPDPPTTGIQDMGYSATLDAVDYAPAGGWSPTGSAELIVGHNYVVRTRDGHYAKFRVTSLGPQVVFDWAYQVDPGNRELRVRPAGPAALRPAAASKTASQVVPGAVLARNLTP